MPHVLPAPPSPLPPEDRCALTAECDAPFETTIVGWAGATGWVFDACWPCARKTIDIMSGWRL
jgi:hypothetical protein